MPLYEYKCVVPVCGKQRSILKSIDKWNESETCECGHLMVKKVSQISIAYINKTRAIERKAAMEGSIIYEPGLNKDAQRNREYQKEEMRENIRRSVVETISNYDI